MPRASLGITWERGWMQPILWDPRSVGPIKSPTREEFPDRKLPASPGGRSIEPQESMLHMLKSQGARGRVGNAE